MMMPISVSLLGKFEMRKHIVDKSTYCIGSRVLSTNSKRGSDQCLTVPCRGAHISSLRVVKHYSLPWEGLVTAMHASKGDCRRPTIPVTEQISGDMLWQDIHRYSIFSWLISEVNHMSIESFAFPTMQEHKLCWQT